MNSHKQIISSVQQLIWFVQGTKRKSNRHCLCQVSLDASKNVRYESEPQSSDSEVSFSNEVWCFSCSLPGISASATVAHYKQYKLQNCYNYTSVHTHYRLLSDTVTTHWFYLVKINESRMNKYRARTFNSYLLGVLILFD